MTDEELREMVRASIARTVGSAGSREGPSPAQHASFARLPLLNGSDTGGACLIEPAVRCSHCGYCLSYGH